MAIEQQNGDYNLTGAPTVFNKTASADGVWDFEIKVGDGSKNLHSTASTLSYTITIAGQVKGSAAQNRAKTAGVTRVGEDAGPFRVASGDAVVITLESDNASDTDVDVTVTPREVLNVANVANTLLDQADGVETSVTLRQAVRIMAAVLAGKITGASTGTETFKGLDGSTTRVEITTDATGNRTAANYTA